MDKEKVIKQLDDLRYHCEEMKRDGNEIWGDDVEALKTAIVSIEAWDKVEEDIKHSQFIYLSGDKEIDCIPIFEVMNILNKHLKEI